MIQHNGNNNKWQLIRSNMLVPQYGHYILDGIDDNTKYERLDSMEIFDSQSNTLVLGPRIPIALVYMAAVVVGRYIVVVIGGLTP